MGDIKKNSGKVEDSKAGKLPAAQEQPAKQGIEVHFGNVDKLKILLLQAINNNLIENTKKLDELLTLMKDVKNG